MLFCSIIAFYSAHSILCTHSKGRLDIKKKLLGKDREKANNDVFSFIEYIIEDLTEAKRIGNAGVYSLLLKKLKSVSPQKSLRFEDINYKFLKRMETLHYSKSNGAGGLSVYHAHGPAQTE